MALNITKLSYASFLSLDGGRSSGSGFQVVHEGENYLVTAKHVLFDEDEKLRCNQIIANSRDARNISDHAPRILSINAPKARIIKSTKHDVAAIAIDDAENCEIQQDGIDIEIVSTAEFKALNDLQIAAEIFLVGFPSSLISKGDYDFEVDRPLLRKGIIAGINEKTGTFIVDCPSYYGNSGAPIIERCDEEQFRVCGIVSRYIPLVTEWRNNREPSITHAELTNSGYTVCVPSEAILNLLSQKK